MKRTREEVYKDLTAPSQKEKNIKVKQTNNKGMDALTQTFVDMFKDNPRFKGFDDIDAFDK